MNRSICYISNDFSKHLAAVPDGAIIAPEALLTGQQIQEWVSDLAHEPKLFATCSLYLLRELYLQSIPVVIHNLGVSKLPVTSIEELTEIEILDRDLEQSERYMYHDICKSRS